MGRRREKSATKSHTLPSSPSHSFSSSSSSDFEFTISISPRTKSSSTTTNNFFRPADELFYKGQLLPLHLSPRLSMVRTLLLASSSSSSSSDTTTTASPRDSTGSSSTDSHSCFADCDSSRPSSVAEDDEFKRLNAHFPNLTSSSNLNLNLNHHHIKKTSSKYFSLSRFSSVFRKEPKQSTKDTTVAAVADTVSGSSAKRTSNSAKDVIRKYLKKVKPLYEKLSQKQQQQQQQQQKIGGITTSSVFSLSKTERSIKEERETTSMEQQQQSTRKDGGNNGGGGGGGVVSHSFSGNLRYPRRKRSIVSSCPSSMRSSPSHSGVLSKNGFTSMMSSANHKDSSMEELQSAIQGAIAHCKNSMLSNKTIMVSNNEI